jgi:hypothetical protein
MNDRFTESKHESLLFTFFMFISPIEHCNLENFSGSWHEVAADF